KPIDIASECLQHRIGIQPAVDVSIMTNLNLPVVGYTIPEISGFFKIFLCDRLVGSRGLKARPACLSTKAHPLRLSSGACRAARMLADRQGDCHQKSLHGDRTSRGSRI